MTGERVIEVAHMYKPILEPLRSNLTLDHCYEMLDKIEQFVNEGRLEKAFRWLGFVQGCMWSCGVRSIIDMKYDNKPDEDAGYYR